MTIEEIIEAIADAIGKTFDEVKNFFDRYPHLLTMVGVLGIRWVI